MIQKGSCIRVVDNSGASIVQCIQVVGGYRRRYAHLGDTMIVSVKSMRRVRREKVKIKKGDVVKAVLIRAKVGNHTNAFGVEYANKDNGVMLLSMQNKYLCTRIFGGISTIFRYHKYLKAIILSSGNFSIA